MRISEDTLAFLEGVKEKMRVWRDHNAYNDVKALAEKKFDFPEDPWKYFKRTKGTVEIPLSQVDTIRYRVGNRAEKYMADAYYGEGEKRKPILLKKNGKRYSVEDGNSTVAVAKKYGWKKIPALISE